MKKQVRSGAKWETQVGYSRAVRIKDYIAVSGTTAIGQNGEVVGVNDAYRQTLRIFEIIENALKELDASMQDVIRTRIFITDLADFPMVAKAHAEKFGQIAPAATCVEINRLVSDELLVEIEVDAVVR